MTHTTVRAALALCAAGTVAGAALAGPSAAARTGADGAYPLKDKTYATSGQGSGGYSAVVTMKIGAKVTQVKKLVVTITCAEGTQKLVQKNLAIDDKGYIEWDERWPGDFFGQFTSRHKVDRVSVQGDSGQPCSTYVVSLPDAKDR